MSEKEDMGEPLKAPADFKGPADSRGCTDILCLLLIVGHWLAMTALGAFAIQNGNYEVILYPMDVGGNICGIHYDKAADMAKYPNLYYINTYSTGVCVSECPTVAGGKGIDLLASIGTAGVQGSNAAAYSDITINSAASYEPSSCSGTDCYSPTGSYINNGKGYAFPVLDTYSIMNRCVMTSNATAALDAVMSEANGLTDGSDDSGVMTQIYSDLWEAQPYILGFGFCVAMVVSFIYSYLLRIPGVLFIMIWGCIFCVFAMFLGMGGYAYKEQQAWADADPKEHTDTEIQGLEYVSYGFMALAFIWFLLICFLRKRIQLSLAIVKQAAKAVAAMPLIIVFPIMQCAAFVGFMAIWMVYAVYLASLGEPKTSGICSDALSPTEDVCTLAGEIWIKYQNFEYDDQQTQAGWYLLFCYFWTSQFIIAVGQIVVAMCVAKWYFARDKSSISNATVTSSIKDAMWYHTGTAAFGSLIIAIIKMIRAAIAYAQRKAKESGSKVAQAVLCALQCYMWCMEKCMKFLNKNAYIQTAIFGTNFCSSAKAAFFLILRNVARIGACTMVSEFVIIIGKAFICVMTGGFAYFLFDQSEDLELYSPYPPIFFIMIMSWFTASMFMNIFGMAISTILQCFVADEEMFDASSRFAESELASFIDENGAPAKNEKEDNTL